MKKVIIPAGFLIILFVIVTIIFSGGEYAISYTRPSMSDSQELKDLKIREDEEHSSYKLLDSAKGIYQIPIDSAISKYIAENNK